MKILVVDDEALLVKGIRFNLQNEGYEVITGSNGLEALQLVQQEHPDLVVLDVMMPEMDGLTACEKIREFSNVPIIMLTAKTDDMDKLIGFDHGVDDYLTKPFNILELKARIRALLRRSASHAAIPTVSIPVKRCWTPSGPMNTAATFALWMCTSADFGKSWRKIPLNPNTF